MSINAFLFDLDGTLVDSIPDLTRAVNLLRNELDLADLSCDQVRTYVGDGVGLLLQRALPEDLFSTHRRQRFVEIYTAHLTDETTVYPGIFEFLEMHRDKPMAVVTNKPQHLAEMIVDRLQLAPFFADVIGAERALQRKPHPDMVHHALRRLDCAPQQTVLFGDHHVDLRAAHAAGVKSCFCAWGLGHDDGLQADFSAITTADLPTMFPEER
ncbi:MAG: HAD-IA family hydrolase [Desulfuromonadales bacterium]|jgi:phosphoglycolate phosphatase